MRVKVLQGPLCDQIGLLSAVRPHERVLVLLQLLGGERPVELARNAIEAV
jgi:transcription antitermination factor NusG